MENHNIFLTQSSNTDNNISGKISYTSVIESIPENKLNSPISNWEKDYNTEWRWRFMKDNERHIVEISKKNKGESRLYYNKYGEWVVRNIDDSYDKFVVKEYYVYTHL
ncbi:hypothetical protein Indivirus_1_201 [Indivirus ILV1]|uniref:Uncharacterized protein n=1 Tax=Indivirus ILV1 TaxID=1977633 RepID=A0A1V0SD46_9VIRU|nr:hypothetical protein Indivirus_1_201 [Indivirus ILV1]